MNLIETVPAGANLAVHLNGRPLGIIESNPEFAFSYWAERQRRARDDRRYSLRRGSVEYRVVNGQWRAT
ncbi:hypothetical protein [Mesorhizobium sp.]|uniref:hypothetical protein n=1 Tax=Mesorhizobium sp. TaxID=1871066 RepID=UPI000FE71E0F|nr:hypothetical protein [Mesorhizobium sp.]RWI35499.1 MAG: hypothetical protein EOR14_28770 [Mesorhizobium sp.]RWJ66332.1 MAG: hypothetical protein EOR34_28365 [Mesorhizobium sp.]